MSHLSRIAVVAVVSIASLAGFGCRSGAEGRPVTAADQMAFGVEMAREGLWNEAMFRFRQAARSGSTDHRLLNNLAVASEALGRFDDALRYYERALAAAPGNRDLRHNHDRFVSFYDAYRKRSEEAAETPEPEEPETSDADRAAEEGDDG